LYEPYKSLWLDLRQQMKPVEESSTLLKVELNPGRSWRFIAGIATEDEASELLGAKAPAQADDWTAEPNTDFTYVRRRGALMLAVSVETERSAFPLNKHPLVLGFDKRFRSVLDKCAGL
jgi:hypothetical protein